MSRIGYARFALADMERLSGFLITSDPLTAAATHGLIYDGITVLARHPLIGRPVESGLRELIISRGRSGYVALYRYDVANDEVLVLAIRPQREAGHA